LPKKLALVHRIGSTYGALDPLFVVGEGDPIFGGAAEFNGLLTRGALGCFGCFGIFIFKGLQGSQGSQGSQGGQQGSQGAQHAQQGAQHDEQHGAQHVGVHGLQLEGMQQVGAHAAHKDPHVLHVLQAVMHPPDGMHSSGDPQ